MAAFADAMLKSIFMAPQYLNERVVVDETELKGAWDFDLKLTPRGMIGPNGPLPGSITLFEAIDKLGLKLEPVEVPLSVIVVDSVNEKPTPNAPNVAESLDVKPAPTEFEVAEIKPSDPDFRGIRANFYLNNRWIGEGLKNIEILPRVGAEEAEQITEPTQPEWRKYLNVGSTEITPPDLLVRIQRIERRIGSRQHFQIKAIVQSPGQKFRCA